MAEPSTIQDLKARLAKADAEIAELRASRATAVAEALRESEERYRAVFESIDEGVVTFDVMFDAEGKVVDAIYVETNVALGRMTGLTVDIVGKRMSDVLPNLEPFWFDTFGRVLETGAPSRFQYTVHDLEDQWFDVFAARVGGEGSSRIVLVYNDITERKRAEAALRESEARHRLLVGSWAQAVWETDPAGVVVTDSPSWRAYTGQTMGEWLGYGWLDAIHPDDRAHAERLWQDAMGAGGLVNAEFRLRAPDGGWRWTNVRAVPVLDEGGAIEKWAGINIDIDDRKHVEEGLRASEEKYRTIFDSIDEGFCLIEIILDDSGKTIDLLHLEANPAYERYTGLRDIVGKRAREIVPEGGPWLDFYGNVALTGQAARSESYLAGSIDRWIASYASRVGDEGSLKVAVVFNDITERKRAEAAVQEREERQAFLLKLSDALRAEAGVPAVGDRAVRMIAEKLGVDRVYLATLTPGEDKVVVTHETRREDLPPLEGSYRGSDFPSAMKEVLERTIVYDDVRTDDRLTELDRMSFGRLGAVGFIATSIRRGEDAMIWAAGAVSAQPRSWTATEISFFEDAVDRTWAAVERARAEEKLRESELRFRTLADTAPAFIWFNDEVGANVFVNQAFLDYTGRSAAQVAGDRWHGLLHPDQEQPYVASYLNAVRTQTPWRGRNLLRRADGVWHWCDNYAKPLFRDDGSYRGHVGVLIDVDDKVRAEEALRESKERQAFLLKLSDALRPLADPMEIARSACRLLVEHLGGSRAQYAELSGAPGEEMGEIRGEYVATGAPMPRRIPLSIFGEPILQILRAGQTLVMPDAGSDFRLGEEQRHAFLAVDAPSTISVPLVKGDRWIAALTVHDPKPRDWRAQDVTIVEEVAERTWAAIERARAEAALQASEEQYRTLFESVDSAVTTMEVIFDAHGRAVDCLLLDNNPAVEKVTGVRGVTGKRMREFLPDLEDAWFEKFGRVASTGQSERFEEWTAELGLWLDLQYCRVGGEGSRKIVGIYSDITERKRAEAALRESEERQAFLLELSDALGPLTDTRDIKAAAAAVVSEWLDIASAGYAEVEAGGLTAMITDEHNDGRIPNLTARYTLMDFASVAVPMQRGETIHFADLDDDGVSPDTRAAFTAINVRAAVATPLIKNGVMVAYLFVAHPEPRIWTTADLEILREVAERTWAAVERAQAEEALRRSEARFSQFADSSSDGLWIRNAATLAMEYVSPAIETIYGVRPDAFLGDVKHWAARIVPDDRNAALKHLEAAKAGDPVVHEFRIQRPSDGAFRWIRNTDFPLFDAHGGVERIGGIAQDVTDAKLATEHQGVLLAELQHRVRNIMAMIRSVTARTGERAESVAEYSSTMMGRLLALARVQALLTRAANVSVGIATIVRDEVSVQAQHEGQYVLEGADVALSPKAAEVLTLAVHELATNALKYGALSVPNGKVTVRWSTSGRRGTPWLTFDWTEDGAPAQPAPSPDVPRRRGFGSELIEGRVPYELKGRGTVTIEVGGARCHLEFPLDRGASILETSAPQRAMVFGGALDMSGEPDLSGHRVLVIEDDYYLATDAARALQGAGAVVMGPCGSEADARAELDGRRPDAVILDINLGVGPSFKLAEHLKDSGIPFVFTTGYDQGVIPPEFDAIERLEKPFQLRQVVGAASRLVSKAG